MEAIYVGAKENVLTLFFAHRAAQFAYKGARFEPLREKQYPQGLTLKRATHSESSYFLYFENATLQWSASLEEINAFPRRHYCAELGGRIYTVNELGMITDQQKVLCNTESIRPAVQSGGAWILVSKEKETIAFNVADGTTSKLLGRCIHVSSRHVYIDFERRVEMRDIEDLRVLASFTFDAQVEAILEVADTVFVKSDTRILVLSSSLSVVKNVELPFSRFKLLALANTCLCAGSYKRVVDGDAAESLRLWDFARASFETVAFPGFLIDQVQSLVSFQSPGFGKLVCAATDYSYCQFQQKPDFTILQREEFSSKQSSVEQYLGLQPGTVISQEQPEADTFIKLPGGGAVWAVKECRFQQRGQNSRGERNEFLAQDGLFLITVKDQLPVVQQLATEGDMPLTQSQNKLMCADDSRVFVLNQGTKQLFEVPFDSGIAMQVQYSGKVHCFIQTGPEDYVGICSSHAAPRQYKLQHFKPTDDGWKFLSPADLQFVGNVESLTFVRLLALGGQNYVLHYIQQKQQEEDQDRAGQTQDDVTDQGTAAVPVQRVAEQIKAEPMQVQQRGLVDGRPAGVQHQPTQMLQQQPGNIIPRRPEMQVVQLARRQPESNPAPAQTVKPDAPLYKKPEAKKMNPPEHIVTRFKVNRFQACEIVQSDCASAAFKAVEDSSGHDQINQITIDSLNGILFVQIVTKSAQALFYQIDDKPLVHVVPFDVQRWYIDKLNGQIELIVTLSEQCRQRMILGLYDGRDLGDKLVMTRCIPQQGARVRQVGHFLVMQFGSRLVVITMRDMYLMFLLKESGSPGERKSYEEIFKLFKPEDMVNRNTFNMRLAKNYEFNTPFFAFGYDQSRRVRQAVRSCVDTRQMIWRLVDNFGILMVTEAVQDEKARSFSLRLKEVYLDLFGAPRLFPNPQAAVSNYTRYRTLVRGTMGTAVANLHLDPESPLLYKDIFDQDEQKHSFPLKDLRGIAQCGSSIYALTGDKRIHSYEIEFQPVQTQTGQLKLRPAFILTRYFDLTQLLKIYVSEDLAAIQVDEMYGESGKVYFTFSVAARRVKIVQDFSLGAVVYDGAVIE